MGRRNQKPLTATEELTLGEHYYVNREMANKPSVLIKRPARLIAIKNLKTGVISKIPPPDKKKRCDRDQESQEDSKSIASSNSGNSQHEDDKMSELNEPSDQQLSSAPDPMLYYVHYLNSDRRLDHWVERDRFVDRVPNNMLVAPDGSNGAVQLASGAEAANENQPFTRSQKKIHVEFHHLQVNYSDMDATTQLLEREHEHRTLVKNVGKIYMNGFEMHSWYYSPYPTEMLLKKENAVDVTLYICDFCLVYTDKHRGFCMHQETCKSREPPGDEIYRDSTKEAQIAMYEVHGRYNKTYCQSLCLLSKLFLDHKTLYFDVDSFIFYVLCEVSDDGARIMGHFSKEIGSENNLACIMILPPYQNRGYGKLLIQFSYELSRREGWIGTPEKPLSDLGKVSYRSYWFNRIIDYLSDESVPCEDCFCSDLAHRVQLNREDVLSTMETYGLAKQLKTTTNVVTDAFVYLHRDIVNYFLGLRNGKSRPDRPALLLKKKNLKWKAANPRGQPIKDFMDERATRAKR